jgi:molecular chaperone DnaK
MNPSESVEPVASQPPVGIDLGTTYSLLAYLDESGRPLSLRNTLGDLLTPSAVIVDEDEIVVGKEAVKASVFAPENYAECFKRDMGRETISKPINGVKAPPEVLSALVLERLKEDAETRLGPLTTAVITVPAYFDEVCRKATQDAGRLAGWEVLDIINEPTAAALCCGWERGLFGLKGGDGPGSVERVLVYDLGGGTFDVSVLEIQGKTFRTLATDGDIHLGGKDFDKCLVDHVAERFDAVHGRDPRSDPGDAAQLWRDVQDLKHALTEHKKAVAVCFHDGIRMRIEVTRGEFEGLTRHLLQRTMDTAGLVVQQADLRWPGIDRVMVVGGATRMPMVVEMLRRLTGKEPDRSLSADEAVAHGAALYAGMLIRGDADERRSCELINVNSHSLGVVGIDEEIGKRVNAILIPRNTPIPARVKKTFKTLEHNQRSVVVPVVEGESDRPEYCVELGKCVVRGLPPDLPKGTLVEVAYRYADNGRLSVSAVVSGTGQSAEVEIERTRSPIKDDLATWRKRLLRAAGEAEPPELDGDTVTAVGGQTESDRSAIYGHLDRLYTHIGQLAVNRDVPEMCQASKRAAVSCVNDLKQAQQIVAEIEQRKRITVGAGETGQASVEAAQAHLAERQAVINRNFAFLVLGREAVRAGFCPAGAESDLEEARRLRDQLTR